MEKECENCALSCDNCTDQTCHDNVGCPKIRCLQCEDKNMWEPLPKVEESNDD